MFDCSREVILPAAPQIVWDAVATKEGNAGWLFPNDVDPDAANTYEPPAHLHIRHEQGESFNDLSFMIEDRGDGTTGLRYAHNLRPNFMGIRTADALYCFCGRNAFGAPVAMTIHAFDGRDPARAEQTWQRFLATALV